MMGFIANGKKKSEAFVDLDVRGRNVLQGIEVGFRRRNARVQKTFDHVLRATNQH